MTACRGTTGLASTCWTRRCNRRSWFWVRTREHLRRIPELRLTRAFAARLRQLGGPSWSTMSLPTPGTWPARSKPSRKSWPRSTGTRGSSVSWTWTATQPRLSQTTTASSSSAARPWSDNSWKRTADEHRAEYRAGAGDWARVVEFPATQFSAIARTRCPGGLLGLYLRQLRTHASLCESLERPLLTSRTYGYRRPYPRVHLRS